MAIPKLRRLGDCFAHARNVHPIWPCVPTEFIE